MNTTFCSAPGRRLAAVKGGGQGTEWEKKRDKNPQTESHMQDIKGH